MAGPFEGIGELTTFADAEGGAKEVNDEGADVAPTDTANASLEGVSRKQPRLERCEHQSCKCG